MARFAFGIDLGTTNSCISVLRLDGAGNTAEVIPMRDGSRTLPSCVWYKKDGSIVVGKEAYNNRFKTDEVVYSSKRAIGTQKIYQLHGGKLQVTPTQVATEVLTYLKNNAEFIYGKGNIKDITITVPAYFSIEKRAATRLAAEKAGMNVISIINEPTSAALAFMQKEKQNVTAMVVDFGGGTFDTTILEYQGANDFGGLFDDEDSKSVSKVLSTAGDDMLGGDDIDSNALDIMCARFDELFHSQTGDAQFNLMKLLPDTQREEIILKIEKFKKEYKNSQITMKVPVKYKGKAVEAQLILNDHVFREAFKPIYRRMLAILKECIAGTPATFSQILLVGGGTKLAYLKERLRGTFKDTFINDSLNPDEAVALGAATMSGIVSGDVEMTVSDVLPQTLGVATTIYEGSLVMPDRFSSVIKKGTTLPATRTLDVQTTFDDKERIKIDVYQGESPLVDENDYLGSILLEGATFKKGYTVSIALNVDANGLLTVTAKSAGVTSEIQMDNILKPKTSESKGGKTALLVASWVAVIESADIDDTQRESLLLLAEDAKKGDKCAIKKLRVEVKELGQTVKEDTREKITSAFGTPIASFGSVQVGGD